MDEDEMEDLLDELVDILEPVADGNASPRDLNKAVASAYELVDSALSEIRGEEPEEEGDQEEEGDEDEGAGEDEEDEEDEEYPAEVIEGEV